MATCCDKDTDNQLANTHSNRSSYHQWLSSDLIDEINCRYRRGDIDDTDDSRSEERGGVAGETERLEDDGGIVYNYFNQYKLKYKEARRKTYWNQFPSIAGRT